MGGVCPIHTGLQGPSLLYLSETAVPGTCVERLILLLLQPFVGLSNWTTHSREGTDDYAQPMFLERCTRWWRGGEDESWQRR